MIHTYKNFFVVLILLCYSDICFSQLNFLFCNHDKLQEYRIKCAETECSECESGVRDKSCNSCISERADSCYCLTYLGGVYYKGQLFDYTIFSIHGNFCGWRNAASIWRERGSPSKEIKLEASSKLMAVDLLDEICKKHDLAYLDRPINICAADRTAIAEFQQYSYIMKSTPRDAVLAVVMKEALKMNSITCKILELYFR